ncbi:MAG: molecular chaperone [Rhodanobacteraceae bacterium]|nr:molecular chaperone [Rhodanobacteraceae bacterium]
MYKWSRLLMAMFMFVIAPVHAFKLTPIEAEFGPGRLAVQTFKVENPGAQPVAIELSVHARSMAASGEDVLTPAAEAFAVFPDQIVLQPGETQSVRVQWTGTELPTIETAYRLMAEQLPITLGNEGERSGLRLMVKYLAALYVRPADPAAVLTAEIASDVRDGQKVAVIRVDNRGNAHAVLQASMIEVSAGGKPVAYSEEQREAVHGKNVLAGVRRELVMPWSPTLDAGALTVALKQPAAED